VDSVTSVEDIAVRGARLHTELRGSGPLLVCVVGGNGDPTVFGPLAAILAARWRVLTYVRRGFVRSAVDNEVGPDKLGADVEDLATLIEHHGGPAVVLGSSSGAIVVLELLVRRPDLVRAAVAHEPPLISLLEDRDAIGARFEAILSTYRREGAQAAMAEFGEITGVGMRRPPGEEPAVEEIPAEFRAMRERWPANNAFWFEHEYGPYPEHEPELAVLRAHAARLVLAVGRRSRAEGQLPSRPNLVLARELGLAPVEMPGGHLGYLEDPTGFATALEGAVGLLAWGA
jgi:pimeloyl-ACP methyl ester carboxylesterase